MKRLIERIDGHMTRIDGHMTRIDGHMTRIDGHMTRIDGHMERIDGHMERGNELMERLDGHMTRIDGHMTRIDGHMERGNELMERIDGHMERGNELMERLDGRLESLDEELRLSRESRERTVDDFRALAHEMQTRYERVTLGLERAIRGFEAQLSRNTDAVDGVRGLVEAQTDGIRQVLARLPPLPGEG